MGVTIDKCWSRVKRNKENLTQFFMKDILGIPK